MRLDAEQLHRAATAAGFPAEPYEKVVHLVDLLDALFTHPYLGGRLALKGGTALNLFVLDMPRLSVDIDLNYIGAADRETMLAERPRVDQAVQAVCQRQGLRIRRVPDDHAGGKWRLTFDGALGATGRLEVDLNFMLRTPLWPPQRLDSPEFISLAARRVPVLDIHELAAGKLSALFSRNASRDLFDTVGVLARGDLDRAKLRFGFVVYGAMSRRDWRTVFLDDVALDTDDAARMLAPLLRSEQREELRDVAAWSHDLVRRCRELLSTVLPLSPAEREFLEAINGHGEIRPELLTGDHAMQDRLARHPGLLWKAQNVREYRRGGH